METEEKQKLSRRFNLFISEEQHEGIRYISYDKHIPIAEVVRLGINLIIKESEVEYE